MRDGATDGASGNGTTLTFDVGAYNIFISGTNIYLIFD